MSYKDEMNKYLKDLENDSSLIYNGPFMIQLSKFSILPYDIIEKYAEYLDWYEICQWKHMSIKFMSKPNILPHLRFELISSHQRLTEEFIEKYADKLAWSCICNTQKLSEKFLLKHMEDLIIEPLLYNKKIKLTDNFWRSAFTTNPDIEINGKWISNQFCQPFSKNFIREFRDHFKNINGRIIGSRDRNLWKEFGIKYWEKY